MPDLTITDWWEQFSGEGFLDDLMKDPNFQEVLRQCATMWTIRGPEKQNWEGAFAIMIAAYSAGCRVGTIRAMGSKLLELALEKED